MKNGLLYSIVILFIGITTARAQDSAASKPAEAELKQYFFVMLTKGPSRSQDSATAAHIQDGHMANITRLHKLGKILVAGPFCDDGDWRGIFLFDCKTKGEVEAHLNTDPAIAAGRLIYEIHPWWTVKNAVFK